MLLAGKLEISGDEDQHTTGGAGGLAIDGADAMLALLEGETGELGDDVLRALNLLTFERQHGGVLIQAGEVSTICIEGGVVVLHEGLRYGVWIHTHPILYLPSPSPFLLKPYAREPL